MPIGVPNNPEKIERRRLDKERRAKAKARGEKRYSTGLECANGHVAERYVSTGQCVECVREWVAKDGWHKRNREHLNAYKRRRYRDDPEYVKLCNERIARYRRKSVNARLAAALRQSTHRAFRRGTKNGSFVRDLGCSIDELRLWLEGQFAPGMNWKNWGTVWELDHVRPLASFDLRIRRQFLEACHYTNLQPLFIDDHRDKSAREKNLRHQHKL